MTAAAITQNTAHQEEKAAHTAAANETAHKVAQDGQTVDTVAQTKLLTLLHKNRPIVKGHQHGAGTAAAREPGVGGGKTTADRCKVTECAALCCVVLKYP